MNRADMFTAIRPFAPGQRFTPAMVSMIDALADRFGLPRVAATDDWMPYALDLIRQFEGCKLSAYPDPASNGDPWTIGWGATGEGIRKGVTWTQEEADYRLAQDVARFGNRVTAAVGDAQTTGAQMGAMVSLAYNIGSDALAGSTLLKMHKAGDYTGAAMQFGRWNRANGKVMAGLTRRREAEAKVYRGDA